MAERLVDRARAGGVALTGEGGSLTGLVRQVLEVGITDHFGDKTHAVEGRGSGSLRNGYYPKILRTEIGDVRAVLPVGRRRLFATVKSVFAPARLVPG